MCDKTVTAEARYQFAVKSSDPPALLGVLRRVLKLAVTLVRLHLADPHGTADVCFRWGPRLYRLSLSSEHDAAEGVSHAG